MAAPYNPPVKNQDFIFRLSLEDYANPGNFKSSPTIASGDFKSDLDGAGLVTLNTIPAVDPAGTVLVKVTLSSSEMNGDVITLVGVDQTSPKEWADRVVCIQTMSAEPLTAAAVNAEVVDALNVDTYAEPGQGNPAATTTITGKLGYLYKAWRNKHTQTATEYALYADDGTTKDQEAGVADDGATFTRNEIQTGA